MHHRRVPTRNRKGWTSNTLNEVSEMFVEACGPGTRALDIGAAFGIASLAALARGAEVWANDIDADHLAAIAEACPPEARFRLHPCRERFPRDLSFPEGSLDSALASNVLHFLTGRQLEQGAASLAHWLVPGGRVFVQAASVHLAPFAAYLPVYEARRVAGEAYPGWIENVRHHSTHRLLSQFPKSVHLLDVETLGRVFRGAGFAIERCWLYRRRDLPLSLATNGLESVGMVARKPGG